MMPERFTVTYKITPELGMDASKIAEEICYEQTVEVPPQAVPASIAAEGIIAEIIALEKIDIENAPDGQISALISYRSDLTAYSLPQFFNVVFGNISIKKGIQITDLQLSPSLSELLPGPRHGINGVRKLTEAAPDAPLSASALKPVGLNPKELASLALEFAAGGISIIKDDHGITNQTFAPFKERVKEVHRALKEYKEKTGRDVLYFPTLPGPSREVENQLNFIEDIGIRGVLIAPMLYGLEIIPTLRKNHHLAIMAHPAFAGSLTVTPDTGMSPAFLYGKLMRLLGADITIFPSWGGRFPFSRQQCLELAEACRSECDGLVPILPCPAGGMTLDRLPELKRSYGSDTLFLIGGGLLADPMGVSQATEMFTNSLKEG
jgi:ribulose-bisphosphate carboxylase large chain